MNIVDFFNRAAEQYPDHIAIIQGKKRISYRELAEEVEYTAAYFRSKGIQQGDRVLVFVPMGIDLYRIVLGLFSIGATAVFLDEWVSKKRMELCCEIADCKGFIGIPKARILAFFSRELRKIPIKLRLKGKNSDRSKTVQLEPDETALITFTTGSTGRPKAASRSHSFLKEQFDALIEEIEPTPEDVDMPVLPIVLFVNLGVGCTSVIAEFKMKKAARNKIERIADQIKRAKVSRITASPFFLNMLAEYTLSNGISYPELKKIFTGGAPVFPAAAADYLKAFPACESNIVYGSTEAEPISRINAKQLQKDLSLNHGGLPVGKIYHKTRLAIITITPENINDQSEEEFRKLILSNGQIGEIVVSGPHVLASYYNSPEAYKSNKIQVDGQIWHRTGDSGFLLDGDLYLTGRCSQLIYHNECLLSPFIIENQLEQIKGITCGTLIESPSGLLLCVESNEKSDLLTGKIAGIPYDHLLCFSEIPRDPRHHSKIDYPALKEQALRFHIH